MDPFNSENPLTPSEGSTTQQQRVEDYHHIPLALLLSATHTRLDGIVNGSDDVLQNGSIKSDYFAPLTRIDEIIGDSEKLSKVNTLKWAEFEEKAHEYGLIERDIDIIGAIRNTLTIEELAHLSLTDELTGLVSRRGFNQSFQNYLGSLLQNPPTEVEQRAHPNHKAFAIIVFDADNFKKVNNDSGHLEGDRVLVRIAHSLRDSFRKEKDVVARWGGEEFIVFMRLDQTELTKQEVYEAIEKHRIEAINDSQTNVTLSAGAIFLSSAECLQAYQEWCTNNKKQNSQIDVNLPEFSTYLTGVADSYENKAKKNGKNRLEHPNGVVKYALD